MTSPSTPDTVTGRRLLREAWVAGVQAHFPGEPKAGYITPWVDTPQWEREAAGAVCEQAWQQETDADIFEAIEKDAS
ncbi:hypothetical protein [Streptomyces sp. NBC_01481]|uniref:hypothetical protein n=1 Tax=Streptomyces sp. NBC_01481 TaxID=2975869 RepID=UPI002250BD64|nr:hypothetical protein [Streptomyces sp. NBC_01481]MCX4588168.1 hypothetical protein [Streptomyces sp. NBC_01481]